MKRIPKFKSYICIHSAIGTNFEVLNNCFDGDNRPSELIIKTNLQRTADACPKWTEWILEMQDYLEEWEVNNCIGILLTAIKGNISILNTFAKQTNSQITLGAYCYRNGKVPILNIESKNMRVIKRLNNVTLSLSID